MADASGTKPDKYGTRLDQAVEYLRGNVKWTLVAFGAIGTTLLAGSQLSNLGKFGYDAPRLWFALACAALALGAAAYAIRSALKVAFSGYTELYDLQRGDIQYVEQNKGLLEGFTSVADLKSEYERSIATRHGEFMAAEKDADRLASNEIWFTYLDGLVDNVLSYVRYNKIRQQVDRSRSEMTTASAIAAIALVGFAWAANPPSAAPTIVLQSPAAAAKLRLTEAGIKALTPVLGAACAALKPIDVITLNVSASGSEVVTLKSKTCPVARFTLTPALGALSN